jgi:hypothetical protein
LQPELFFQTSIDIEVKKHPRDSNLPCLNATKSKCRNWNFEAKEQLGNVVPMFEASFRSKHQIKSCNHFSDWLKSRVKMGF